LQAPLILPILGKMKKPRVRRTDEALSVRRVAIDTYRENVAYLHRDCLVYRTEGFQALSKIEITSGNRHILAVINVVDDEAIVAPNELGLSEQAFTHLGIPDRTMVRVGHPVRPMSFDAVRRKITGEQLNQDDFNAIVGDITENHYSKPEIAAFIVASSQNELDRDEILYLTRSMLASGDRLDWQEPLVADKHCIGGIPGNRTSMLVVPIVAAHGMLIPKTSSRAITSPAGTADTMEVLATVELPIEKLRRIVQKHRGCLAWGGTARLSPADDILIAVERPLGIDARGQLVASILSKKLAAGSTHLLIDIPVGPTAKVRQMREAQQLRKLFEYTGDQLGLHLEIVITDGRQPVGNGIGPVLEARDVMRVLQNHPNAPIDLRQKALRLAGRILEFDPDVRGGRGFAIARDILDSGRALEKMQAIITSQGKQGAEPEPGRLFRDITSPAAGVVIGIDNLQMARIARYAGAPAAKGAGVDLFKKLGDRVTKGDALYRIHAEFAADFRFAQSLCKSNNGYQIGRAADIPPVIAQF
jgi:thymidine phosphorylase